MQNIILHIDLDNEPEKEELAFLLNNADDFLKKLEFGNMGFQSIKIFINTPEYYHVYEKSIPLKNALTISDEQEEFWDDDDEDFIDEDSDWEDEELDDFDCNCFDEDDESSYLNVNKNWKH